MSNHRSEARADTESRTNYHTHALTRGLTMLEVVARSPEPPTLSELHERTELPKSTLVRLARALCDEGYLVRIDERPSYRLGHKVLTLSQSYLQSLNVADLVRETLQRVARDAAHTVNLGVLEGTEVLHLAVEMPPRPLRFDAAVGSRADTYCTGLGKTLLASLPPERVAAHLPRAPWPAETPTRHTGPETLVGDLERIRERGYALDVDEFAAGLTCLAVPVRAGERTVAALSISGPSGEFDDERVTRNRGLLLAAAAELAGRPEVVSAIEAATLAYR